MCQVSLGATQEATQVVLESFFAAELCSHEPDMTAQWNPGLPSPPSHQTAAIVPHHAQILPMSAPAPITATCGLD